MAWERQKIDTGIERVNFVVTVEKDPELYYWIQSLPFGKLSSTIKAVLLDHIERGGDHPEIETARSPKRRRAIISNARPARAIERDQGELDAQDAQMATRQSAPGAVPTIRRAPLPQSLTDDQGEVEGEGSDGATDFLALQSQIF